MKLKLIAVLVLILSCTAARANEEQLIKDTYDAWVQVTNARDIEQWMTYLSSDAVFTPPGSPVLITDAAIREYYEESFADPAFSLDCEQLSVDIADSGDMAWARGYCHFTFTDPNTKVVSGKSRWFKVWLKQTDGTWKCKVNTWNIGGTK